MFRSQGLVYNCLHNVLRGCFLNGSLVTHAVSGAECCPPLFRWLFADIFSHMFPLLRCFMPSSATNCVLFVAPSQIIRLSVGFFALRSFRHYWGFSCRFYQRGAEGAFLHGSAKRCPPRRRREAPHRPPVGRCAPANQLMHGTA